MTFSKDKFNNGIFIVLSGLIFCFYAFINKYPMSYPDTGAYIYSGFNNKVFIDRPIAYGWFLRHISLSTTLWLPIFIQGLLIAYLINKCFKEFSQNSENSYIKVFITSIILTSFSSISALVSQLMPDVFTSISILSMALILFGERIKLYEKIFLSFVFVYAAITHFSHLNNNIVLIFIISLIYFLFRKRIAFLGLINMRKLILVWCLCIGSFLTVGSINLVFDNEFYVSKSSNAFFIARMAESGILKEYLRDHCYEENLPLCQYTDSLPKTAGGFLWEPNSPFYKVGAWNANAMDDYGKIIKGSFSDPKFLKKQIVESIKATMDQLFIFDAGNGIIDFPPGSSPYENVKNYMPEELNSFNCSYQSLGQYDFRDLNNRSIIILCICMIFLVLIYSPYAKVFGYEVNNKFTLLLAFILLALLSNAFICGTFANVYGRLQARVVWLLPMVCLIVFLDILNSLYKRKYC